MSNWISAVLFTFCAFNSIHSQEFNQVQEEYGLDHTYSGSTDGGGVSFYDFNQDGWDDLSLSSGNGDYKFYVNDHGDLEEVFLVDDLNNVKSLIWVDYDNDGDADLSVTEKDGFIRIFENTGDLTLSEIEFTDPANVVLYNTSISWGDYDEDGLLDFYVGRYPEDFSEGVFIPNLIFKQTEVGVFQNMTDSLHIHNGHQHTYACTWADFDNDDDLDLFVANDRSSHLNALYSNDGDGTFTDMSEEAQLDIGIYSMTSTVGDYDNDGDLDIYNSNQLGGNHLQENLGDGIFDNLFPNSGTEAYAMSWGATWIDYDNNGWKDLFVCLNLNFNYETNALYVNNENGTFSSLSDYTANIPGNAFCSAKGDINNDGKYDLLVSYQEPYESRLLLNNTSNANNYVKVKLEGTISNRDAIGSKIFYYIDGMLRMEFLTCGSDYLSQDSQTKILAIGEATKIDSLQVQWPSGIKEWYYLLEAGSTVDLIETNDFETTITGDNSFQICEGEEVTLTINSPYTDIIWSDNSSGSSLTVNNPGEYWATVSISDSFSYNTDTVAIELKPQITILESLSQEPLCFGNDDGLIEIIYSSETEYSPDTLLVNNLESGNHFIQVGLDNHCNTLVNMQIDQPSELFVLANSEDASCYYNTDGSVSMTVFGGVASYEFSISPSFPLDSLPSGNYVFTCTDANGCTSEGSFEIESPDSLIYDLIVQGAENEENGAVLVNNLSEHDIAQITVYDLNNQEQDSQNLTVGEYTIQILDEFGCQYSDSFLVPLVISVTELSSSLLTIYPNPSSGLVYVDSDYSSQFMLLSLDGKLVNSDNYTFHDSYFDFSRITKGAYILKSLGKDYSSSALLILE